MRLDIMTAAVGGVGLDDLLTLLRYAVRRVRDTRKRVCEILNSGNLDANQTVRRFLQFRSILRGKSLFSHFRAFRRITRTQDTNGVILCQKRKWKTNCQYK